MLFPDFYLNAVSLVAPRDRGKLVIVMDLIYSLYFLRELTHTWLFCDLRLINLKQVYDSVFCVCTKRSYDEFSDRRTQINFRPTTSTLTKITTILQFTFTFARSLGSRHQTRIRSRKKHRLGEFKLFERLAFDGFDRFRFRKAVAVVDF